MGITDALYFNLFNTTLLEVLFEALFQREFLNGARPYFCKRSVKYDYQQKLFNNKHPEFKKIYTWIEAAKNIHPELCDWIGIYFKESFIEKSSSSDLILGPFIGEETEHIRISIYKGICGRALREERAINISDVTKDPDHIACSLKTRSELVIPLKDKSGSFIAELDIDCNQLNAFSSEIEKKFVSYASTFDSVLT